MCINMLSRGSLPRKRSLVGEAIIQRAVVPATGRVRKSIHLFRLDLMGCALKQSAERARSVVDPGWMGEELHAQWVVR